MCNKCIYTKKTDLEATFKKREHIFPAGIGGIKTLDNGLVCDEINEFFSKLEISFMRESIISIPRMFVGPGKRGRGKTSKKQTKSKISIFEDRGKINLGYSSLGKPYIIPQIVIDCSKGFKNINPNLEFYIPPTEKEIKKEIQDFIQKLNIEKFIKMKTEKIKENEFIIGYENKIYIASNPKSNFEGFIKFFKEELSSQLLNMQLDKLNSKAESSHVNVTTTINFNINDYYRICAKIAFNALAYLKGQDYVLNSTFDEIRNFIVNGGENKFVSLQKNETNKNNSIEKILDIKKQSHNCIIFIGDKQLRCVLSLYGMNHLIKFNLEPLKDNKLFVNIDGFFCDWEDKCEQTFEELMLVYLKKHNKKS